MKYLKKYSTDAEYQADTKSIPQVSWVDETEKVEYEFPVPPQHDYSRDYLTLVALGNGSISFNASTGNNLLSYSTDDGSTWTQMTGQAVSVPVIEGDKVLWKGNAVPTSTYTGIGTFSATTQFNPEGNAMSLLFGDDFQDQTDLSGKNNAFARLFKSATIVTAENLILPATKLSSYCYWDMFNDSTIQTPPQLPATSVPEYAYCGMFLYCRSLTTAPELPATTLAIYCYKDMFNSCSNLTNAPVLSATTLANYCYRDMFMACIKLNSITCLATDISASGCLDVWVSGVAATGTFTKAASMTSWPTGASGIPTGWTVQDYSE